MDAFNGVRIAMPHAERSTAGPENSNHRIVTDYLLPVTHRTVRIVYDRDADREMWVTDAPGGLPRWGARGHASPAPNNVTILAQRNAIGPGACDILDGLRQLLRWS
eukprot:4191697-Prymnesium_polylepis.1